MRFDDQRTLRTGKFLHLVQNAARYTREPLIVVTAKQLDFFLWDWEKNLSSQDRSWGIIGELEPFISRLEASLCRAESPRRGVMQRFLGEAMETIPGLLGLWKHYDEQKKALERILGLLHLPLVSVGSFSIETPKLNLDLENFDNLCVALMSQEFLSAVDTARFLHEARKLFTAVRKYDNNQIFTNSFEEAMADFEVISLLKMRD